ncbi:hypothetical protein [Metabacillus fastidiosus]|uniref:hypothetical protein n=1 Tax=Metabacillus fastidiosus TaxID=1458 RepID=UPI0008246C7C|nr:hypothetical protein [Metabacillus fastidiosus]MED4461198.1 hypothetical protein [Metabacillus fastidiosus]
METSIDIMRQSLDLQETVLEGLEHVQKQISEGKFEDTISLFRDIVQAFFSIESSLKCLPDQILIDEVIIDNIRGSLNIAVNAYESKNYMNVQEVIEFKIIPMYKEMKIQLEQTFNPYIIS